MKRYDFKDNFDPYCWCDAAESEEYSDGEWVPASVAQALYDALMSFSRLYAVDMPESHKDYGKVMRARKALSLADGEE